MQELEMQLSCPDDRQILGLIRKMCQTVASGRPDATQIVSEILDFQGNLYYGFCCDRSHTGDSSGRGGDATTSDYTTVSSASEIEERRLPVATGSTRPLSYQPPFVQDAPEENTGTTKAHSVVDPSADLAAQGDSIPQNLGISPDCREVEAVTKNVLKDDPASVPTSAMKVDGYGHALQSSVNRTLRVENRANERRTRRRMRTDDFPRAGTSPLQIEHLGRSHVRYLWQLTDEDPASYAEKVSRCIIPDSSLVPSLFLACTNSFTCGQIESMFPQQWEINKALPLFVYGSLMFPAILKALAAYFVSEQGKYSAYLQRRLRTDAKDWAHANESIENAAARMTPAFLPNHARWKPSRFNCANLSVDNISAGSEVAGFLIFGLSQEAILCLEHVFMSADYASLFLEKASPRQEPPSYWHSQISKAAAKRRSARSPDIGWPKWLSFKKHAMFSTVRTKEGGMMTVQATAFVAPGCQQRYREPWDVHRFVRGRSLRRLSRSDQGSRSCGEEESLLAKTLGITRIHSGDALCEAILADDRARVRRFLREGHDVNATCSVYGSALTAAAFKGSEDIVAVLLDAGAEANNQCGEYRNALIAATLQGNEGSARLLLQKGAECARRRRSLRLFNLPGGRLF